MSNGFKNEEFTGVLAEPMTVTPISALFTQEQQDAEMTTQLLERVAALYDYFKIDKTKESASYELIMKLALKLEIPAFRIKGRDKVKRRGGNNRKWHKTIEGIKLYVHGFEVKKEGKPLKTVLSGAENTRYHEIKRNLGEDHCRCLDEFLSRFPDGHPLRKLLYTVDANCIALFMSPENLSILEKLATLDGTSKD